MKVKMPPQNYILITIIILAVLHESACQKPRDGLRQKEDRYQNTSIPNNCDDKIYAITEIGNLIEIEKIESKDIIIKQLGKALPFKCNAFVKGVNNKIYAVKAYEQARTPLYEYNPKNKLGSISKWVLPSNEDGGWVSGAVDSKGKLYFISTTMENLVRIDIRKVEPDIIWTENLSVEGWRKENCKSGCNFFINQMDELVVKENRGNRIWNISITNQLKVVKADIVNTANEVNPTNDIMEYINSSGKTMTFLLGRNTIYNYSTKKNDVISIIKIDTLKLGFFTEIAGCNNFIKKEENVVEQEKDELITAATGINESVRLKNIIFRLGESELQPESFSELDKLVRQLKKYHQIEILLEGHTDITGDSDENIQLSLERVNSCKKYLVNKGIEGQRIQTKGYGNERPLKRSGNEKEREINRRVEFKIIKGIGS
ncbi:MAG: OmpA family protein [Arcicella sp.]|nr:OmpA family protein [Arcicella sp.]